MSRNLVFLFVFFSLHASAQTINGRVVDSASGKGLSYATISLVKASDSVLVSFSAADSAGLFRLTRIPAGRYLLWVSYAGYVAMWKPVTVSPGELGVGEIGLSAVRLQDVNVIARRPPVEINNDTLEFNTENFKTQPNAVVEDLLRKMPGVTIESDGTVKVNGQKVKRVLVNGKDFFTGDTKMATKNLNADAVDKVQVYDRASDQASFTGVDDGNSEKTINLKLKKGMDHALFGKLTSGGGTDGRFDAQGNVNRFSGDEQMSFIGMGNNTNRQGFSLMDVLNFTGELARGMRNGGGGLQIQGSDPSSNNGLPVTGLGQNQQGVATTIASGVNYNNTFDKGRSNLNSNYTVSHIRLVTDKESAIQNLLPGNIYTTLDSAHTVHSVMQQRLGITLDQQLDSSLSFKLTPVFTWQHSDKKDRLAYISWLPDATLLNNGNSQTGSAPGAFNFATDALLRKKLAKKGRTLSADINIGYNHSTSTGTQVSDNFFYAGGVSDSAVNQYNNRDAVTRSFGGNITYTEPIGTKSLVALTGFFNTNTGSSSRQTFNYDPGTGKHDQRDSALSNDFSSDYEYSGGTLGYRTKQRRITFNGSATLQAATLRATDNSAGKMIRQSFTDVLPYVMAQYAFSKTTNLKLEYNTYTTQPSVVQLQPVADLSDPLNIRTGNPDLKRTYNHQVGLTYFSASPQKRTDVTAHADYRESANSIVESDSVNAAGVKLITPVNTDGVRALFATIDLGFSLNSIHSRIDIGSYVVHAQNVSFLNGVRNKIASTTIGPSFGFDYSPGDKLDIELKGAVTVNSGSYSLQPALNTQYMRQNYAVNATWWLPWELTLHNEFNIIFNSGRAGGYNTTIPLWNASLARNVLKNDRGEIKFSVMDLLNRNTGITRSINQGSIVDEQYNVLRRYFLLSFTYSLSKAGLKNKGMFRTRTRMIGGGDQ